MSICDWEQNLWYQSFSNPRNGTPKLEKRKRKRRKGRDHRGLIIRSIDPENEQLSERERERERGEKPEGCQVHVLDKETMNGK